MSANKVALITGASRGIGRGIAVALGQQGWTVVVNYRGNAEAAAECVSLVESAGGKAHAVQGDVSVREDRSALLEQVLTTFGRIDLLVNNAGMAPRQRVDILEMTEESFDEVMNVNLKGPYLLTQMAAKNMIELIKDGVMSGGQIINIGSMSAYVSSTSRSEYCVSKAGMAMMTKLYADRLANEGITVYEIRPGIIATDMTSVVTAKYDKLIDEGLTPIRRWGLPEDVGKICVAIAEGYLPYSTGEVINVDGGIHLQRL
ncbi:MAG: 3-ketoacyl-ACP reductase [Anaerolineaceae bacterium]|nr:3-ketoacyl-ACP reductase [Anaerolineaceae bacterium]